MKRKIKHRIILGFVLVSLVLLGTSAVLAVGESLPRSVSGSAGGQISGGGLKLLSALGQPAAGVVSFSSSGSGIRLCTGFLCGLPLERRIYLPVILQ